MEPASGPGGRALGTERPLVATFLDNRAKLLQPLTTLPHLFVCHHAEEGFRGETSTYAKQRKAIPTTTNSDNSKRS